MHLDIRHAVDPVRYKQMNTMELRDSFLVDDMFVSGKITMVYSHVDRAIIGSAVPAGSALLLETSAELASDYFAQRREIGAINIGNSGMVSVDGVDYELKNRDVLYIGRGSNEIRFQSEQAEEPARFYFISYPAHTTYSTMLSKKADASPVHLGTAEHANKRTIYKHIYPDGIRSCQLVMGFTELENGSVWNTMAPHTHVRRSEVYMYFDVPDGDAVFHFMGEPEELRTVVVHNGEAVISPVWSIHAGAGTRNYSFVWAMGGENQDFDDMDFVAVDNLK